MIEHTDDVGDPISVAEHVRYWNCETCDDCVDAATVDMSCAICGSCYTYYTEWTEEVSDGWIDCAAWLCEVHALGASTREVLLWLYSPSTSIVAALRSSPT